MQRQTTTVDLTKAIKEAAVLLPVLSSYGAVDTLREAMYLDLANSGIKSGINYCISNGPHPPSNLTCGVYYDDGGRIIYNAQTYLVDYESDAHLYLSSDHNLVLSEKVHFRYPDPLAPAIYTKLVSISVVKKTNLLLSNPEICRTDHRITYIDISFSTSATEVITSIQYHPYSKRKDERSLAPDSVALLSNVLSGIKNTSVEDIVNLMAVDHLGLAGIQADHKTRQDLQALAIYLC